MTPPAGRGVVLLLFVVLLGAAAAAATTGLVVAAALTAAAAAAADAVALTSLLQARLELLGAGLLLLECLERLLQLVVVTLGLVALAALASRGLVQVLDRLVDGTLLERVDELAHVGASDGQARHNGAVLGLRALGERSGLDDGCRRCCRLPVGQELEKVETLQSHSLRLLVGSKRLLRPRARLRSWVVEQLDDGLCGLPVGAAQAQHHIDVADGPVADVALGTAQCCPPLRGQVVLVRGVGH